MLCARCGPRPPCTLPLRAGEYVDLVVQMGLEPGGQRRVREIVALPGRVEAGVVETATIFTQHGDELVRAEGFPPHADRFARHGYQLTELLRGEPQGP